MPPDAAERAIFSGRVTVAGRVVRNPFAPVDGHERVTVDQVEVSLASTTRVLMFHKPRGLVTAGSDPDGTGTVFAALSGRFDPELARFGWHAVGRLDRATTGLLLFTNDERFVQHATSPGTHLPKTYLATVDGKISESQVQELLSGVELDDGPARAVSARRRSDRELEVVLDEGRHHQVRRMLNAVRLATAALHREAVGTLQLDTEPGVFRPLTDGEIASTLRFDPGRRGASDG